jgi:tRNA-modifying protein YgfZ
MIIQPMSHPLHGVASLPYLGAIRVQGEDAAKFLQGQLTQDFALLGPAEARLAAFCNAKGRMQASFIGFRRTPDEILLVCSRDVLPATLKRLSMFVLRAKAKLSDASAEFALFGVAGETLKQLASGPRPPWTLEAAGNAHLVHLYPADGQPRALWVGPAGEAPAGPAMEPALWQWGEVRAGIATVSTPIVEAFVPQMLNYESVGGVNFKKGCYPGQEIVARTQYLGKASRRMHSVHCDAPIAAGDAVYGDAMGDQACGMVVNAASTAEGWEALAVVHGDALAGVLHAQSLQGPILKLGRLPYDA